MAQADLSTVEGRRVTRPRRENDEVIVSRSPLTGEVLGEVEVHSAEQVRAVVARAREAQRGWAELPVADRTRLLLRFRDAIVDRSEEILDLLARECGKPRFEALSHELSLVVDWLSHMPKLAASALAPEPRQSHFYVYTRSIVEYVPRGVVAVIGPWNFPFQLTLRDVIWALAAGNAVVVKPSEVTPLILVKAKELWDSADLPEDLFGLVTGAGPTGAALIDGGVDMVVFTGSVATGRRVAAACGERLIPCVMELGGKAPLIACADCDIERTAQRIVLGGFANSGQICLSIERVYAHTDVHDALVERVVQLTEKLKMGDPAVDFVDLGAITFAPQIEVVERLIADALQRGAELRCGGKRVEGYEQMFEPTVLSGCDHECAVMREEIFGPIVPFMRVACADEAIRLANESHLGLNAYVFTEDPERGLALARRIEAGNVVINDVLVNAAVAELPFGGIKHSGFGRVLGPEGLRAMCHQRAVTSERFRLPKRHPFGYPYRPWMHRWLLRTLRTFYQGGSPMERLRRLF